MNELIHLIRILEKIPIIIYRYNVFKNRYFLGMFAFYLFVAK